MVFVWLNTGTNTDNRDWIVPSIHVRLHFSRLCSCSSSKPDCSPPPQPSVFLLYPMTKGIYCLFLLTSWAPPLISPPCFVPQFLGLVCCSWLGGISLCTQHDSPLCLLLCSRGSNIRSFLLQSFPVHFKSGARNRYNPVACFSFFMLFSLFSSLQSLNIMQGEKLLLLNSILNCCGNLTARNQHRGFRKPASRKGMETSEAVVDWRQQTASSSL